MTGELSARPHTPMMRSRDIHQACRIRRLSGPDEIDIYVDSEPQGTNGPQGARNASMDQDGEQDGGGRVGVSMSRRVPYHDRLCAREVRLQGEAESAAQPTIFWGSQSVGGRSMGP